MSTDCPFVTLKESSRQIVCRRSGVKSVMSSLLGGKATDGSKGKKKGVGGG